MPFKNDLRRRVTLNLYPEEYTALQADARDAGYASPGTYALALVVERGEAPAPITDRRSAERLAQAQGAQQWLQAQFDALAAQLREAGLVPRLARLPLDEPLPHSWNAQQRAIKAAVAEAIQAERARGRALRQAKRDAAATAAAAAARTPPS